MSVRLGAAGGRSQAELDGLMARVLKNELAAQKYLYTTEWRSIPAQPDRPDGAMMLVLAADELRIRDRRSVPVGRDELAARLDAPRSQNLAAAPRLDKPWTALLVATALRRGRCDQHALFVLEMALTLVQALMANAGQTLSVWLLTAGAQAPIDTPGATHAGVWGLARSARVEEQLLPLRCIDGSAALALERGALRCGSADRVLPQGSLRE